MEIFSFTGIFIFLIIIFIILFIIKNFKCCRNNSSNNDSDTEINVLSNNSTIPSYNPNYNTNFYNIYNDNNVSNNIPNNVNENDILNLSMKTYFEDINNNLSKLEIYKYSKIEELFGINTKKDNISCPICFEDYNNDDNIYNLKCNHIFHSNCLRDIALHNAICPLCRKNLFL